MLLNLGAQVGQIHIAVRIAVHRNDIHAGHMRRRRIGPVRRGRNQTNRALNVATLAMIGADREQSGIFALRPRIGLQRNGVVARDRDQLGLEIGDHLRITPHLVARRKRMRVAEAWPGQRHHLGRSVELHGAGTERNHRPVEREIAIRQPAQIPQHLGLRTVLDEYRMGHELARAE